MLFTLARFAPMNAHENAAVAVAVNDTFLQHLIDVNAAVAIF